MKKLIIFLLCVAVLGGGGYFGMKKYKDSKQEKVVVDVVPVSLMMQDSDYFDYYYGGMDGRVQSSNTQRVYIDTEKLVKKVYVEEGQSVKKGDAILEYDMTVVELELAQKENAVKIVEQDIKMAKKELEKIRNYKPSEDAPQPVEPDYPDYPDDIPDDSIPDDSIPDDIDPDVPDGPPDHLVTDIVKPAFTPVEGVGTAEMPFIINCTQEAEVSREFMIRIASEKKCAEICVYDESYRYLYKWIIVPTEGVTPEELASWKVSEGITIDEDGSASIDTDVKHYGKLSFTHPTTQKKDDSSLPEDDSSMPELPEEEPDDYYDSYEPNDFYIDPEGTDYVYSRDEIKHMISEKEDDIKQLEIDLKQANFELQASKKRKVDGKLYAELDGIVKKIGKASSDEEVNEEEEKEDIYEEPDADDRAFAVIQGDGGTEVVCEVSELNLSKYSIGDTFTITSWNTDGTGVAEITKIDDEPVSYNSYNWGENPNNSSYQIHAKLIEGEDVFSYGDWVELAADKTESDSEKSSNSVYLPIHYVRQEGGDYYIMKADEDGKLKKQYVKVGQIMYGYFIEIKGGLSYKDKICFPYGKEVKEGTKTRESTEILMPDNMDFF
ncbi:MAG: biotin/lipoyl-binding protein [Ruminococcus sp.]|uniref:biotin/lipoyl-binding protein n=1 Tax=Ruminococcus sp. TaxID=41978 RepID=UPI0025EDD935|nr:biotin/lipoyl-binding protein [Ruminococcus sp.]MBO4865488.1 biotin/lipoyl-binding protein [Ruminococcus sp.]